MTFPNTFEITKVTAIDIQRIFLSPQSTETEQNVNKMQPIPFAQKFSLSRARKSYTHIPSRHLHVTIDGATPTPAKKDHFSPSARCALIESVFSTLLILFAFTFSL